MTPDTNKLPRTISSQEADVVRAALYRAPRLALDAGAVEAIGSLRVVAVCSCGCASVYFADVPERKGQRIVADGLGTTPHGGTVGLIVWGSASALTGLEIYDLGAGQTDLALPIVDSIVAWEDSKRGQ